jgi:hypothetical protein
MRDVVQHEPDPRPLPRSVLRSERAGRRVRGDHEVLHGKRQSPRLPRLQVTLALVACLAACARSAVTGAPSSGDASVTSKAAADGSASFAALDDAGSLNAADAADAARARTQIDDDGNDDPEDPGQGTVPESARFTKVGTAPLALTRICDLTAFGDALYAAHANQPLGTDGATITRYRPDNAKTFGVAFDWNRPGEPVKGGGAGQGFLRVHAIGGRLFVADADPPYNGLGLVEYGTEGYVFVSDRAGSFAPPRAPHYRPPSTPDLLTEDGRAGAAVLPRAYHVIDVVKFRGALYASTGSVPPKERAWHGASPGALHRASDDGSRWTYEVDYPYPWKDGVWRLTFMVRFRDRLYAGIQDYDGRDPNDYLYFAPSGPVLTHEDTHPVRVTRSGAAGTLRWWVDTHARPARLYWLAWSRDTGVVLRITTDGDHWAAIALPADAGRPTDVTRFRDSVVVLTERGLYKLAGEAIDGAAGVDAADGVASVTASVIAPIDDKKSPFEVSDFFCVAPLAVFKNELYAGGQRGGSLYRLAQ